MTRQEAIAMIEDDKKRHHDELSGRYRAALTMAIEALEQEPMRGKWIPVTESLPEEGLTVLIFAEGGEIEFGQRYENKWEWLAESIADYWTEAEEVIAWQPLPEPYKENE